MFDVATFFPLPSMRPSQQRALEFIRDAWQAGKRTVLLDLPTGVGKSPIAIAAAGMDAAMPSDAEGYDPGTYIVTTQKILQAQYMRDFPGVLANVMAKQNYACAAQDGTCQDGYRIVKMLKEIHKAHREAGDESDDWRDLDKMLRIVKPGPLQDLLKEAKHRCQDSILPCNDTSCCPYSKAFMEWRRGPISLTNAAFFFNAARMTRFVKPRSLLIIDEAHLLEDELVRHLEVRLDRKWLKEALPDLSVPCFDGVLDMVSWIKTTLSQRLKVLIEQDNSLMFTDAQLKRHLARAESLKQKADELVYMVLNQEIEPEECADMWLLDHDESENPNVKPLGLAPFGPSKATAMGYRQIFMSGTILDPVEFCDVLGLDPDEVAYYGESSPFPDAHRPVVIKGCGSMAMKSIAQTRPKVIETIGSLLKHHDDEKGIIHAGTYAMAAEIRKTISDSRLLFHDDAAGRNDVLQLHATESAPTVLVSPSMTVGVDLKDDLARWCVVCKVPWPFLGDKRIDMLRRRRPSWYAWKAVQDLMQACGRVVRSEEDCAVVYILDDDFDRLYRDFGHMFPEWWRRALLRSK